MENYLLYETLSQSSGYTVYKGRRKGSTEYVSLHCIEKYLRPYIANTIRLTHNINHKNVAQFYEWYETSTHLWLVAELCVGGSLQEVMLQDGQLPEKAVFSLGLDLVRGLHYLHSLSILFCDFSPTKVLVDSPGTLKYGDFTLARLIDEDLADVLGEFQATDDHLDEQFQQLKTVNPLFAAPEVLQGNAHSQMSDIWSLGKLLHHLFSGDLESSIKDAEIIKETPLFLDVGQRASEELQDLVHGLTTRDPARRYNWDEIITHSFWRGEFNDSESSFHSDLNSLGRISRSESMSDVTTGHDEDIATPLMSPQKDIPAIIDGVTSLISKSKSVVDRDSNEQRLFMSNSRPFMSAFENNRKSVSNEMNKVMSPPWMAYQANGLQDDPFWTAAASLLYHPTDLMLSSLAANPRIQRLYPLQWELKSLPVQALSVADCLEITTGDFQTHWKRLLDAVGSSLSRNTSQKKIHILNYMASLALSQSLVTRIVGYECLKQLLLQVKSISQADVAIRAARVMALVASNMTYLEKEVNMMEIVLTVTEVLRAQYRDSKLRHSMLMVLGELVILVARMEHEYQCMLNNWSVPSVTVTIINRCLQENDDSITNHYAAKIVENVSSFPGRIAQMFAQNDICHSLWYLFTHTPIDGVRVTSISALCRMTLHSAHIFQAVLEKAGLEGITDALKNTSVKIQQSVLTMIGAMLAANIHTQKFTQDKELLQSVLHLLCSAPHEYTCTVVRAKVFLVIAEIIKHNRDGLVTCCSERLQLHLERAVRQQTVIDSTARLQWDYMYRCIELLIKCLSDLTPSILGDLICILKAVHGRKHPNSNQAKQLRASLPLLSVILSLVNSQVFRPQIINENFFANMGSLLELLKCLEKGETAIDFVCGANAQDNLTSTALSILEAIGQHPAYMDQHSVVVASKILSPLATLIVLNNCDTRFFSLKIFTDIVTLFLSKAEINQELLDKKIISTIHEIISETLLPHLEDFLQDSDPIPSHMLRLLQSVLEQSSSFVHEIEKLGLTALLFQLLKDHQNNPLSSTVQSIVGILTCMLSDKMMNINEFYDFGLIEHMSSLMCNTAALCINSSNLTRVAQDASFLLLLLLDGLLSILNRVASVVRKTVQAQKKGEDMDPVLAENLLQLNRPLAEIAGILTQLLCHSDTDVQDLSCRLLSLLVQLYGAECHFALLPGYVDCFGMALNQATTKKQKVLIKILLRLVTADPDLSCPLRDNGKYLIAKLEEIASNNETSANGDGNAVPSLASQLLNVISCS